jgi:hypothetical protein
LAELTGDLLLTCNGTAPATGITANLTVSLNTSATSRVLSGASEALLLINEPAAGAQSLGVNLFEGVVSGNQITFFGIPLVPAPGGVVTNLIIRITNVRANESSLMASVVANLSVSGLVSIGITTPVQIVALAQPGLKFSATCASPGTVALRYDEGFPTSFKVQGGTGQSTPGTLYNTESGFTPDPVIAGVGTADSGTELEADISGLPAGAQLSVPASVTEGTLTVTAAKPLGGGTVPIMGSTATIIYEVTAADPNLVNGVRIPVTISGPAFGSATVRGNLAAMSTVGTASASAPIPRFADVFTAVPFGESCSPPTATPTATPTNTPTATPTNTPVPQGGACSIASQCATGSCADGVCCNTACDQPLQRCNLPGQVGTCASAVAPAPALTPWGLLAAGLLLVCVASFALRHRLRDH